ncbi:type II toxin-antitoxin system RelE/ParE family toxin [Longimicrobium sp.]|uniref:type II toxin-antitoxin system RelE/ParE family toxin n=1 Tax=Longimicrobium sp. TaxID=2029185 RepID=UPI002C5338F5|nr:type II toxin-antitoxin system RelE/ParE family toxin [Longimicrobium sp.]HSU13390.1 type II toxin-antitoxin system RelE/ParE family toxin [Longimicrobium sp.]
MKPVRWHRIAIEEARLAAEYYRSQREGLDERFSAALAASTALLEQFPALGAPVHRHYRRVVVHRFPYSLIYREHSKFLRVVAVVHHKLDPASWIGR